MDAIEEIVDFEPNRYFTVRVITGGNPNLATYTFDEIPGGTQVTHRYEHLHTYASCFLGSRLLAGPVNQYMSANREKAWQRAKEILENETP